MVFVLFLTSLAVIEYLLRRDRAGLQKGPEIDAAVPRREGLRQTDPASLLSLADAIERQGRGAMAGMDPKPAQKTIETLR